MDKIPPDSNLELMCIPCPSLQNTQALAMISYLHREGKPKDPSGPPHISPDGYRFSSPHRTAVAGDKLKQKSRGCEIQMRQKMPSPNQESSVSPTAPDTKIVSKQDRMSSAFCEMKINERI